MTRVADIKTAVGLILDRNSTVAEQTRIADAFIFSDPYHLGNWTEVSNPDDPEEEWVYVPRAPTNEEKAILVADSLKMWGQGLLRQHKEFQKREADTPAFEAAIKAEGDTAALDMS